MRKITLENFILKSSEKHNYRYNYDNVLYINNRTNVLVNCIEHGDFLIRPDNHLMGNGCYECSGKKKLNLFEFIERSNKIHNFKYNYNKVVYKSIHNKVLITCLEHGDFLQTPGNHFKGKGCPDCSGNKRSNSLDFIKKSNEIHKYKYSYNKVEYKNWEIKVLITCLEHGDFHQRPNDHLRGIGCPICSSSKGELLIKSILDDNFIKYKREYYFNDLKDKGFLKFDFVVFDENKRITCLIEFNGIQHYEKNFFHKNDYDFNKSVYRDKLKLDYCISKKIPLYIIKYNDDITYSVNRLLKTII